MRSLLLCFALFGPVSVAGCSMFGPKPQVVYHKPKVKSTTAKIVMMPVTNFSGEKSPGAQEIESSVNAGWAKVLGSEKALPAGPEVEELNAKMNEAYKKIISTIRNPASVSKLKTNPALAEYIKSVSETAGDSNLAFAVIEGDESAFENGQPVSLWLAVFDTNAFSWKWITKAEAKKKMFLGWETSSVALVSTSFDKAAEVDSSKVNLARAPASK